MQTQPNFIAILKLETTLFSYIGAQKGNILNNIANLQTAACRNNCKTPTGKAGQLDLQNNSKINKNFDLPKGEMYFGHKYQIAFGNSAKISASAPHTDEKLIKREKAFNKYFETLKDNSKKEKAIDFILKNIADCNNQKICDKKSLIENFPWEELDYVLKPADSNLKTTKNIINDYCQKPKEKICSYEKLNELCKNEIILKRLVPPNVLISRWSKNANSFPWEKMQKKEGFQKILYNETGLGTLLSSIEKNESINEKSLCEMADVLSDENFECEIAKKVNNKDIEEAIELVVSPEIMSKETIANLITSGLTKKDYEKSIQQLAKTMFRAMKTPNLYLNNIPIEHTTKIDGKYPKLDDDELMKYQENVLEFFKDNYCDLILASSCMDVDTVNQMMDRRFETFQLMLEKCSSLTNKNRNLLKNILKGNAEEKLAPCNTIYTDKEKEEYIKKKEKQGKPLTEEQLEQLCSQKQRAMTAREKIQLFEIVGIYQKAKLDTTIIEEMTKRGVVDIQELKNQITKEIFKKAGMTDEEMKNIPEERLKFNEEYSYLLLLNQKATKMSNEVEALIEQNAIETINAIYEMNNADKENKKQEMERSGEAYLGSEYCKSYIDLIENFDKYSDEEKMQIAKNMHIGIYNMYFQNKYDEIDDIIKYSTTKDFKKFIIDTTNEYGKINQQTKEIFKENGIDYKKWLSGANLEEKINVDNKNCTIKLWDRTPQEDLFIGNKTTCCTRIGECNSTATVAALLNTSYNIVELYDDKGEAVGMTRIFMANVNKKPAVIMDNFELNNTFIKRMSEEDMEKIRNGFFNYLHKFAYEITGDETTKVYMTGNAVDAKTDDLLGITLSPDFIGETTQNHFYINSSTCGSPKAMKNTEAKYYTEKS